MVNINIQKKDLWLLSAIMVFLVGVAVVVAYNSGASPSVMGHSAEEVGFIPTSYDGEESITFPNGLIIKQGTDGQSSSATDYTITITFGTPFPNSLLRVILTSRQRAASSNGVFVSSKSASQFTLNNADFGPVDWIAIGY